jgi:hypothetical protein
VILGWKKNYADSKPFPVFFSFIPEYDLEVFEAFLADFLRSKL